MQLKNQLNAVMSNKILGQHINSMVNLIKFIKFTDIMRQKGQNFSFLLSNQLQNRNN